MVISKEDALFKARPSPKQSKCPVALCIKADWSIFKVNDLLRCEL